MDNDDTKSMGKVTRKGSGNRAIRCSAAAIGLAVGLCGAETIRLADGSVIQGEIVLRDDSTVTIRSQSLGTVTVPARVLASGDSLPTDRTGEGARSADGSGAALKESAAGSGRERSAVSGREPSAIPGREPSDQALLFMPTAFTPPARAFTFRDFELFFLTMGYAPTDATSLTGGFLFPISSEVQILTAGAKQRLWQSADGLTASALTANFTKPLGDLGDDLSYFLNSNLVVGKRTADGFGVHAAIGYLGARTIESVYDGFKEEEEYDWNGSFTYAVGMETRLTPHVKILAEYLSAVPVGTGADIDGGLLSLGVRLHGDRLSADIAGTRPIGEGDFDSFLFWPLLVVSYRY